MAASQTSIGRFAVLATFRRLVARSWDPFPRIRLATQLLAVLLVAVLVLATGVWTLYRQAHRAEASEAARAAGAAAAQSHAEEILSYDYRTLERDLERAKADTTGRLKREYGSLTNKLVAPKAKQHHVVVRANVVGSSVISASPDRVVTLLFVDQVTQSDLLDAPRIDQNRVRMTLRKVNGGWLASKIVAL